MAVSPQKSHTYDTPDTILATCLILEGFTLREIIYNGAQGVFVFENNNSALTEYVQKFQMLQVRVEPTQFQHAYRVMITRVMNRGQDGIS